MRASIIIASHNEGDLLQKTVSSCIEASSGVDCEIIIADDASTDGSVESVAKSFPQVRQFRNDSRKGVSPTKALGAKNSTGDVLVFLDGHTKPEKGSIERLVQDVEDLSGSAIVTPAITDLNISLWQNDDKRIGNGYRLDLLTFESAWCSLDAMRPIDVRGKRFFESPSAIGCALALSKQLYEKVLGFDEGMSYWGVEDVDLAFKCWSMGHSIFHDPQALVGHRFQKTFDRFSVPQENVLVNHLRMAHKNFTHEVWTKWIDRCRQRNFGNLIDHPEGLWAHAWLLFVTNPSGVDQERSYLQAKRVRDEFAYAVRFGLNWPRMESGDRQSSPYVQRFSLASPAPKRIPPSKRPRRKKKVSPRRPARRAQSESKATL